jgi:hypothetical protein
MERGGELDDVLVGQWWSLVEDRSREQTGAGVDAVENEDVEVQIEIEGAAKALGDGDRSRAAVGHTGARGPFADPTEQRAPPASRRAAAR